MHLHDAQSSISIIIIITATKVKGFAQGQWPMDMMSVSQSASLPCELVKFPETFHVTSFQFIFLRLNLKTLSWRYIKNNSFGPDRFSLVLGHIIGGGSACFFVDYLLSVIKSTRQSGNNSGHGVQNNHKSVITKIILSLERTNIYKWALK